MVLVAYLIVAACLACAGLGYIGGRREVRHWRRDAAIIREEARARWIAGDSMANALIAVEGGGRISPKRRRELVNGWYDATGQTPAVVERPQESVTA